MSFTHPEYDPDYASKQRKKQEKAQRKAVFDQVLKEHPDWEYTRALAEAVRILAARKAKVDFGADPDEILARQPDYVNRGV